MKLLLILIFCLILSPLQGTVPSKPDSFQENIEDGFGRKNRTGEQSQPDSTIFNTDPDILDVMPQQRSLPILGKTERLKWSFKIAEKNIFL